MRSRSYYAQSVEAAGFSLLDALAATAVFSIVAVGITLSSISASRTLSKINRNNAAQLLAQQKMEELLLRNPLSLDERDSSLELGLLVGNLEFVRQTAVSVAADESRSLVVTVRAAQPKNPTKVEIQHSVALWGKE